MWVINYEASDTFVINLLPLHFTLELWKEAQTRGNAGFLAALFEMSSDSLKLPKMCVPHLRSLLHSFHISGEVSFSLFLLIATPSGRFPWKQTRAVIVEDVCALCLCISLKTLLRVHLCKPQNRIDSSLILNPYSNFLIIALKCNVKSNSNHTFKTITGCYFGCELEQNKTEKKKMCMGH